MMMTTEDDDGYEDDNSEAKITSGRHLRTDSVTCKFSGACVKQVVAVTFKELDTIGNSIGK